MKTHTNISSLTIIVEAYQVEEMNEERYIFYIKMILQTVSMILEYSIYISQSFTLPIETF